MKRLILFLLMVIGCRTLSLSQNTYPSIKILGTDTLVCLTKPQLITINRSLNDYEHLKELYAASKKEYSLLEKVVKEKDESLKDYVKSKELQNERYAIEVEKNKILLDEYKKYKHKSRKRIIGVGVGGTTLGIILGVLLIQ